ncbi:MAG: alpha/beta hydrolase [Sphingorhabdus sp.]
MKPAPIWHGSGRWGCFTPVGANIIKPLGQVALAALVFLVAVTALLYFGQRFLIYPAPQERLASAPPGYRFVETKTADGFKLRAAYRPAVQGKPTLLFFHGNGDSIAGAGVATQMLTDAGYGALLVEYRGYGGNPGSPSEQGLYKDGEAAIAWLKWQGIGTDQLVIIGNSIGSGPATEMALRHSPAALILISGFASLPFVVSDLYPFIPATLLVRDRYENEAKLGRIKSPILILQGDADALVRPVNAERLARAAPKAKLIMVPGAGHELAYGPAAQAPMLDWMETTLLKQAQTKPVLP